MKDKKRYTKKSVVYNSQAVSMDERSRDYLLMHIWSLSFEFY